MKKYKLKRDLPTFKAGQEFWLSPRGDLMTKTLWGDRSINPTMVFKEDKTVYKATELQKFPNILEDWFEEIPEKQKTVWDLKIDDVYYWLNGCMIERMCWIGDAEDEEDRDYGNVFLTEEEAEKELVRRKAKVILERDIKGFKPDWENNEQLKFGIAYNAIKDRLIIQEERGYCFTHIYFATIEDAEASIKAHRKEWKIWLQCEDEE